MNFYVNEDKRIVVAVIPDAAKTIREIIIKKVTNLLQTQGMREYWANEMAEDLFNGLGKLPFISAVYRGKAKCSPLDEWDLERGKTIAKQRATLKFWWAVRKAYLEIVASVVEPLVYNLTAEAENVMDEISIKTQALWEQEEA